ncbi:MAG: DUF4139 domain-containing protein, partial [Lentisphaerae bacterium]|nr:DUF4139 domain-containing protein [Lentisphaerota bacterium]
KKHPLLLLFTMVGTIATVADEAASNRLPVHEITVFKDGHAFIQHSGTLPVDESGKIIMDYLPAPVLGTFWPYVDDQNATLGSVVAGIRKVETEKTALSIGEMIEANIGARIIFRDGEIDREATIVGIPTRSSEELASYASPTDLPQLPQKSDVLLLRTTEGIRTLPLSSIDQLTFVDERKEKVVQEEFRNRLSLNVKWNNQPKETANVGLVYLQLGIRWIPSYRIAIQDDGTAVLKLEATLINELIDLDDVTANLVIGVPSFAFKDSVDPISLREDIARLSSTFQNNSRTATALLSNAILSQMAVPMVESGSGNALEAGPEVGESGKSEDLYMFTVDHITLKKGERMVLPIAEYELSYEDVYTLDIPIAPPMEMLQNMNQNDRMTLLREGLTSTVAHKIRIENKSPHPFTTAPAMILKDGHILAQGMMKYTPVGGHADIKLTAAIDINVKKIDSETKRTPNAVEWNGDRYTRIDLDGKITLKNYKMEPVTVEITRHVLGNLNTVGDDGTKAMINPLEDQSYLPDEQVADWWFRYSWPWWWYQFNSVGRASWTTTLNPGEESTHTYTWHYFWR